MKKIIFNFIWLLMASPAFAQATVEGIGSLGPGEVVVRGCGRCYSFCGGTCVKQKTAIMEKPPAVEMGHDCGGGYGTDPVAIERHGRWVTETYINWDSTCSWGKGTWLNLGSRVPFTEDNQPLKASKSWTLSVLQKGRIGRVYDMSWP